MSERKSAGLSASVGNATLGARLLVAGVFAITSFACLAGGVFISRHGAVPMGVAVMLIEPIGIVGLIATAYVLAPLSRAGVWLDHFVPRLREPGVAIGVVMAVWVGSAMIVLLAK